MNFATLKGLTIPEGNVTQIADASGRALWKSGPAMATVTITGSGTYETAWVIIDGTRYWTANTFELPVGTIIQCCINDSHPYRTSSIILVSGGVSTTIVTAAYETKSYDYTVIGNVTINLQREDSGYGKFGQITITEQ